MADRHAVGKHDDSLQHPADAGKFHAAAQHLKNFIARAYHDAVKFPLPDYAGKAVKSPGNSLRKGKLQQSNAETKQDFLISKACYFGKTPEHKINAEKNMEGYEKLSDASQ